MPKFRKKPVTIDAILISDAIKNAHDSNCVDQELWVRENFDKGKIVFGQNCIYIETDEGTMRGESNDYLIRGVNGEIYPCKPDVFEKTYEPANE